MSIRLVMDGHSATSAAQMIGHLSSICFYLRSNRSGRTPYLSFSEETEIRNILIESIPDQEGIGPEAYWDTRVLQYLLEERYHVSMSRGGICDMLHRLGDLLIQGQLIV